MTPLESTAHSFDRRRQPFDRRRRQSCVERFSSTMRLPFAKTSLSGFVLLIAGVGYLAESLVANLLFIETPLSDGGMMVIRGAADSMVVGLLLVIYASLRRRGRDVEEAYRLGYDVGFENGYRLGRSADAPMVRAAMNSGDKVVPITASRGSTG